MVAYTHRFEVIVMKELETALKLSISGTLRDKVPRIFNTQIKWGLVMHPAERLVLDFGGIRSNA